MSIKINSNKIFLAFHTGEGRKGIPRFYSKAIKFFTKKKFVHVELKLPDWICDGDKTSFSASLEDGGVRFKHINYFNHPERWVLVEFPIWNEEKDFVINLYKKCCRLSGSKYDIKGIFLNQLLGLKYHNEKKWWCSEIVANVLDLSNDKINPGQLFENMRVYLKVFIDCFNYDLIKIPKKKSLFIIKSKRRADYE